jgi:hypothetical protein
MTGTTLSKKQGNIYTQIISESVRMALLPMTWGLWVYAGLPLILSMSVEICEDLLLNPLGSSGF